MTVKHRICQDGDIIGQGPLPGGGEYVFTVVPPLDPPPSGDDWIIEPNVLPGVQVTVRLPVNPFTRGLLDALRDDTRELVGALLTHNWGEMSPRHAMRERSTVFRDLTIQKGFTQAKIYIWHVKEILCAVSMPRARLLDELEEARQASYASFQVTEVFVTPEGKD